MTDYIVLVEERHLAKYVIEADSVEHARQKAARGDWEDITETEFIETLGNPDDWKVIDNG